MHKYLLAAVAAAALASPAAARDGQAYVGVEGGLVLANHEDFDIDLRYPDNTVRGYRSDVHFRPGVDVDAIAGYDFGMFRIEGELAWKSIHTRDFGTNDNTALVADLANFYDTTPTTFEDDIHIDPENFLGFRDHATVLSLMANGLVDFDLGGFGFYAGVGAGRARVKMFGDRDNVMAYQGILGVRAAVNDRVDVGLKYRYFRTGRLNFSQDLASPALYTGDEFGVHARGRLSTHSILGSVIFNLGSPEAEPAPMVVDTPPPPPPAPATQTCPDGSVILATDVCPAPPPPPPAPSGERG
jgi:opacity protein-like surface antigen